MHTKIDMTRPNSFYIFGLFLLLLLSLLITNVPSLTLGHYIHWQYRPYACVAFTALSALLAVATFFQYKARISKPWKVPQSLVQALFSTFFFSTLGALILIK